MKRYAIVTGAGAGRHYFPRGTLVEVAEVLDGDLMYAASVGPVVMVEPCLGTTPKVYRQYVRPGDIMFLDAAACAAIAAELA